MKIQISAMIQAKSERSEIILFHSKHYMKDSLRKIEKKSNSW